MALMGIDGAAESGGLLADSLRAAGLEIEAHQDLAAMREAVRSGGVVPAVTLMACEVATSGPGARDEGGLGDGPEGSDHFDPTHAHVVANRVLAVLQAWVGDERFASSQLVVITRGALATSGTEDVADLAQAAVWGMVRAVRSEFVGRFVLVDIDDEQSSASMLPGAIAAALQMDEPELALRAGRVLVPRLARIALNAPDSIALRVAPAGAGPHEEHGFADLSSVPETGRRACHVRCRGDGADNRRHGRLGRCGARHLVVRHSVRNLLLVSRSGPKAPRAAQLEAELSELGAHVRIVACDTTDRGQVQALISSIGGATAARGRAHCGRARRRADRLADARPCLGGTGAEGRRSLASARADGASRSLRLRAVLLCHRTTAVLVRQTTAPRTSFSTRSPRTVAHKACLRSRWLGARWAEESSMAARDSDATDRARRERSGAIAMSSEEALELFDAACWPIRRSSSHRAPVSTRLPRQE